MTQKNEPILALPYSLGQAVINYLIDRPYVEVHQLVDRLQAIEPLEVVGKESGETTIEE